MKVVKRNNLWFPSIFDDFFPENRLDVSNYENFSIPKVNISENLATFVIELAVPGLNKESFTIEIEKKVLKVSSTIAPKRESADTSKDTQFTRKEFDYSSFSRSFTLPETIDNEGIEAKYEDGILRIVLPKKEKAKNIKRMVEIS
ncbi:MAG: Hsp20/alpha crystallin family protein [Flavobacteriaceae bacterium]|nr:Hsp20/alpha crystallin family protein [Flavobacteriaceae bacterium]